MRDLNWRDWPPGRRLAALALMLALGLDLATLVRLRHLGDELTAPPLQLPAVPEVGRRAPVDAALLIEAAGRAPFGGSPAISMAAMEAPPVQPVAPSAGLRLMGTVVEGDGRGFVVVELPDARMQLVRIGERAGTLRLRSVTAGAAVFEDARGDRISLRSPQAGSGSRP